MTATAETLPPAARLLSLLGTAPEVARLVGCSTRAIEKYRTGFVPRRDVRERIEKALGLAPSAWAARSSSLELALAKRITELAAERREEAE